MTRYQCTVTFYPDLGILPTFDFTESNLHPREAAMAAFRKAVEKVSESALPHETQCAKVSVWWCGQIARYEVTPETRTDYHARELD